MEGTDNAQLKLAFDFVQYTNKNIFLTGKAGTGKTTFLHNLKSMSPKRMIVVAPTGVAAVNAGGVTIHSFFQLPFGPFISTESQQASHRFSKDKINIMKSLDLLVIDEISMVRADLLDGIDDVLRRFKDRDKPFGGVQLLMIGDIQQLAPVAKEDEWRILEQWYDTAYFFSSRALKQTEYISIELRHIYRQSDMTFIDLLNRVRENSVDMSVLDKLNKRYSPTASQNSPEGYIILTTHNRQAQAINERRLTGLSSRAFNFTADVDGDFPEYAYPTDYGLVLKKDAQVMFVKNDISGAKLYYNGKIGTVEEIGDDTIYVKCEGDLQSIPVAKAEWKNAKYTIDNETGEIKEEIAGTFTQYPLKLAWAITIHKSQGLTFEKAVIDASASFAHGQVYVALSRCKTLEGIILSSKLSQESIKSDANVRRFSRDVESGQPSSYSLEQAKYEYQKALVLDLFDFGQIRGQLLYCLKVYRQNVGSLHAGLKDSLEKVLASIDGQLIEVADKFKPQILNMLERDPNAETNRPLAERISKASVYFEEKIRSAVLEELQSSVVVSDNKSVKRLIKEWIEKVKTGLMVKVDCFNSCKEGFSVKTYLDARAKSYIEHATAPKLRESRKAADTSPKEDAIVAIKHPELFKILKKWRAEKADKIGQPAYFVLQQKALIEVVEQLPQTPNQLKLIHGIGKRKIEAYGQEVLDLVERYCTENSITRELPTEPEKQPNTRLISLELLRQGKSIFDIAAERGLGVSTIEKHLADCISSGELDILELVDSQRLGIIVAEFEKQGTTLLSPVKEALGADFSYSELKFVQAYLRNIVSGDSPH